VVSGIAAWQFIIAHPESNVKVRMPRTGDIKRTAPLGKIFLEAVWFNRPREGYVTVDLKICVLYFILMAY
jgi:hypothetical protein